MKRKLRIGVAGLGQRGYGLLHTIIACEDGEVAAVCDVYDDRLQRAADETEKSGVRKSLNMGHTTGHALELHYGRRSHGEYVLIGIWAESFIAEREGVCSAEYAARVRGLVSLAEKRIPHFDGVQEAAKAALLDKKNGRKDSVSMILPKAVGEYAELSLPAEKYAAYLEEIFGGNA